MLAEIETDKATMEVEAVDEGTLGKILVPEGTEGVQVNDAIAVLIAARGRGSRAADSAGGRCKADAPAGGARAKPQRRSADIRASAELPARARRRPIRRRGRA